ncbi:MAG: hypothetical protein WC204_05985 [Elusimicrobiales bacterium]|jgi:hypothetical protein
MSSSRRKFIYFFMLYCCASTLLTWPLILKSDSILFGAPGDAAGVVWGIWSRFIATHRTLLLSAPFGFSLGPIYVQPVYDFFLILPAMFLNTVRGYNFFALVSFPLTAAALFIFLDRTLQNKTAAFIGGLIFGFCPAAVAHGGGGHIGFAFNAFIPFFLISLFHNRLKRTVFSASLVGGSFVLVALTSLYTGYFCLYVAALFVLFDWTASKSRSGGQALNPCPVQTCGAFVFNYICCVLFAALFVIPFEYKAILEIIARTEGDLAPIGPARPLGALVVYSVRMWEYFVPSIDHPVLGHYFENFIRTHLHGSNTTEQTLYLGLVPLGLFLTGIVFWFKNRFSQEHKFYFLFFSLAAAFMCIMSFPPYIPFGPFKIPLIGFFAHKIAPMFRVYARFGILVNMFVACGAAVGLTHLSGVLSKNRYRGLVTVVLIVLVFEYWSIPPNYAMPINNPPEVYKWLAAQPGDFIVAEYPMMPNDEGAFSTYLLWQIVHRKRLVNGAGPAQKEAWAFYNKVNYPANRQTMDLLRKAGVKYLIVHPEMYKEGPIPAYIKRHFPPEAAGIAYNNGVPPLIGRFIKPYKICGVDVVYRL